MNYIKNIIRRILGKKKRNLSAKNAYNLIALNYNNDQDKIIPKLDKILVEQLLCDKTIKIENGLDYGAGTGRNIPLLSSLVNRNIIAYDVSIEMKKELIKNHPNVILASKKANGKLNIPDNSINLILCNLCIGYIKNVDSLFKEWNRILDKDGLIILTDIHPDLLINANRNFKYGNNMIYIDHFKHEKRYFDKLFAKYKWDSTQYKELIINDQVIEIFKNKVDSYELLKTKKALFGYFLKKSA